MANPLENKKVTEMAQRLQDALGAKINPAIDEQGNVEFVLKVPKGKDKDGLIVYSPGIAKQLEDKLDEELNKDAGIFKKLLFPDKVHAFYSEGKGQHFMTRDLAIPADRAKQVIALAEAIKQHDPKAFDSVFPEEMRATPKDKAATEDKGPSKNNINIREQDKALLQSMSMAAANPGINSSPNSTDTVRSSNRAGIT